MTISDTCRSLNHLRDCLQDVSLWMKNSKLKLNPDKTEFLIIDTPTQLAKLSGFFPTHILSQTITPVASALNIGVTFDENFNFKQHISKTCCCCFYHIRDIRRIRWFISCPVHTIPRQDVNRKKFAHIDVYVTCDLHRKPYKSNTCDILNILLSNRRNR